MKRKRNRKEVLGIVISSSNEDDIGKIVKFRLSQIEKISSKENKKRSKFLTPCFEEIMKSYKSMHKKKR